jgi:CRP-like cAMP-binding protein
MEFNIEKYHLKSTNLFDWINEKEANFLREKMVLKTFEKGEYLFKEKQSAKGVYFIKKGKVKIFQTNKEGKQNIVYFYKKNDFFGYRPILAGELNPISAVALEKVIVLLIPKDAFLSVLQKSSSLAKNLLLSLAKEFSVWVNKITVFSQYSVKERIALSLLIFSRIYEGEVKGKPTTINVNRDDFAAFVGTVKESLVRNLRYFKDEKIISSKGTSILLLKKEYLEAMVASI